MRRLFTALLFLEVGAALVLVPWSSFWDRNYFAQALPAVGAVMMNDYVRGAVSGLGVINLYAGLSDLVAILMARGQEPQATPVPPLRHD